MLLAGDVGGTKTLIGLYPTDVPTLEPAIIRRFDTDAFDGLDAMIARVVREQERAAGAGSVSIDAACLGIAGPVSGDTARLTNGPWQVDATALSQRFSIPHVCLLNDVEAMAHAVPALNDAQVAVLQAGEPQATGNRAVIAPGTGLGEAALVWSGHAWVAIASEGGHADFAARTPREQALAVMLTQQHGRVSCERILSGPGLVAVHRFAHDGAPCKEIPADSPASERPARITAAALAGRCARCVETLELFVAALGAEAGNAGLRTMATGGIYLGGGIPPKILPRLKSPTFLHALRAKAPMQHLVEAMPVSVILDPDVVLFGAAGMARHLAGQAE